MPEENYSIGNEKNIIALLLEKDLTRICFKIFSHLDCDSFCNARLVCHGWKDFIDYQFYELPNGIKWRNEKLVSNFLNEDFIPREEKIHISQKIYSSQADEKNIFISTVHRADLNIFGCISNYEFHSLKLVWNLKLKEFVDSQNLYLNNDRLFGQFRCKSGFDCIYIIDRALGKVLHKIGDIFLMNERFSQLCILDCKVLAFSYGFAMSIYNIEDIDSISKSFFSNRPYIIFEDSVYKSFGILDFERIQNDGDKLICQVRQIYDNGTRVKFIARNFKTGEKICEIQDEAPKIDGFSVHWPYLIYMRINQEIGGNGIRIFDMEKETLIKYVEWNIVPDYRSPVLEIKGKIILLQSEKSEIGSYQIETRFLSFEDVMNEKMSKIEMEKLSSRQIDAVPTNYPNYPKYFIVGNCVLRVSTNDIVKRSYWMSNNFDNMSDKIETKTESDENVDGSEMPMKKKMRVKN